MSMFSAMQADAARRAEKERQNSAIALVRQQLDEDASRLVIKDHLLASSAAAARRTAALSPISHDRLAVAVTLLTARSGGSWRGSAQELIDATGLDISPVWAARKLRKLGMVLGRLNIVVHMHMAHRRRTITISARGPLSPDLSY